VEFWAAFLKNGLTQFFTLAVTVGVGGQGAYGPYKNAVPEPWSEVRDGTMFGYGMFRIVNHTVAEWEWVITGQNRENNKVWGNRDPLPPSPETEKVVIRNQYFL